jgi:hypothetical protein
MTEEFHDRINKKIVEENDRNTFYWKEKNKMTCA